MAAQEAVTRVFVSADRRDWEGLRRVLAESVALDYTSLSGGEPADISRDDLVTAWRGALGGFEATQHLLGSFVVDSVSPDEVRMRFYAIAAPRVAPRARRQYLDRRRSLRRDPAR